jgi:hypothetical protein
LRVGYRANMIGQRFAAAAAEIDSGGDRSTITPSI